MDYFTIHKCAKCGSTAKVKDRGERYPWGDYCYTGWVECENCGCKSSEHGNSTAAIVEWNKAN